MSCATPLHAILGFGQLLQREALESRQRQHVDLIVKGGRHLLNLINEVLDISRIEAGKMELSPEPTALADLMHEVVGLMQPMAEQYSVQLHVDEASIQTRCVFADKQRLKQVLLNLVANAIKYNVERGRVLIRCEPAENQRLHILVQDTGPGIPLDKQSRLFTPFDRLGAEAGLIEGSGLGLVLSKRLMEIMDGSLTFTSQVGVGSTFVIDMAVAQNARPLIDSMAEVSALTTTNGAARTLLYIEDNLANVKLIEAVLAYRPGIRLVTAMQGGLGLDLARQQHPDLILLDVHLPDMKGNEWIAHLRTDPNLGGIPVVVIGADATPHQVNRLLSAGAKEYLTKPIDVDQFLSVLDRYLN